MERELKLALTVTGYRKLKALTRAKSKRQRNTYFDDARQSLRKAGAGLRVRTEDGKRAYLTFKCSTAQTATGAKSGWHQRREWENRIPLLTAKALIQSPAKLGSLRYSAARACLAHAPVLPEELRRLGTIETERTPLRLGKFQGDLDRWKVKGKVFYELEVETSQPQAARRAIARLFAEHGIRMTPRSSTKLAALFRLSRPKLR